jgi:hypothetical protein
MMLILLLKITTKDFVHIPEAQRILGIEKNKKLRNTAFIKLLDLNIAQPNLSLLADN